MRSGLEISTQLRGQKTKKMIFNNDKRLLQGRRHIKSTQRICN